MLSKRPMEHNDERKILKFYNLKLYNNFLLFYFGKK